jgi:hypothetical protein
LKHRLKTPERRKTYGRRKATIEPAFGVIKQVRGFRQFPLRGLRAVKGEWSLVSFRLQPEADTPIVRSGVNGERGIHFLSSLSVQIDIAMGLSNVLLYRAKSFDLKFARQSDRLLEGYITPGCVVCEIIALFWKDHYRGLCNAKSSCRAGGKKCVDP